MTHTHTSIVVDDEGREDLTANPVPPAASIFASTLLSPAQYNIKRSVIQVSKVVGYHLNFRSIDALQSSGYVMVTITSC